jgi:phosphoribosylamine--glycine ligase
VSPVPFADEVLMKKIEERMVKPTISGLQNENIIYKGFIYFGLMICSEGVHSDNGEPYMIEYNCRMGDPETEVVMPRIKSDLVELFLAVSKQNLSEAKFEIENHAAATVMLVSGGYPDKYEKGKIISGTEEDDDVLFFHAGTANDSEENLITAGGRVMAVTSTGSNLKSCLEKCYRKAEKIRFDKMYYRKDIGKDVL